MAANLAFLRQKWQKRHHWTVQECLAVNAYDVLAGAVKFPIIEGVARALAGHVSRRMLEHYSHIRTRAKEDTIRTLEQVEIRVEGEQNWAQSDAAEKPSVLN